MTAPESSEHVVVERTIAAPPEQVWALISDVTRMGEWSPETTGCSWQGGATGPAPGARFKGENQAESKRWSTTCEVTACEPGRRFGFDVKVGPIAIARWEYDIEPTAGGSRVQESWTDQRNWLSKKLGALASGVHDRASHNRRTMEQTLDRLAAAAGNTQE